MDAYRRAGSDDMNSLDTHSSEAAQEWQHIYQRLEAARIAIERNFKVDALKKQELLKKRAQALAQEGRTETSDAGCLEVVEFLLDREHYALETSSIREVYPLKELTPVPCTPPFVLGIINVRGQILSVLDLKVFFHLSGKGFTELSKVIILHSHDMEFGILVDAVLGVRSIPLHTIQSSLPTLTDAGADYLKGVTAERLIILDAAGILADEKIVVHEEIE